VRSEASSSDYESKDQNTGTGTGRPSSLPSPSEKDEDWDADGFDEVVLNGVGHSLREEPTTMHDHEENDADLSASKDSYTAGGKDVQPVSNGRVEGGEEFHSIPTTPTDLVMPGKWKGDEMKGAFS